MYDIQELMRRIIRHGFYGKGRSSVFMCNAAKEAYHQGLIGRPECWAVVEAAQQYIFELSGESADSYTMGEACHVAWPAGPHLDPRHLAADCDVWAEQVGRVLYWNWDKRPRSQKD